MKYLWSIVVNCDLHVIVRVLPRQQFLDSPLHWNDELAIVLDNLV